VKPCNSVASFITEGVSMLERDVFTFYDVPLIISAHRVVIDMQRVWREAVQQRGVVKKKRGGSQKNGRVYVRSTLKIDVIS